MDGSERWESASSRSPASSFSGGGGASEIVEEAAAEAVADKVFVALPLEFKAGKSTLSWALGNVSRDAKIVLCHVHAPPQMIPLMGTKFHASKLRPVQVNAYRQSELEKVDKKLDEYLYQCSKLKIKAEKLVFEKDDVVKGLIELIALHGITKLIMGAAADKHYSKKMRLPRSKTSIAVMGKADPSCKIWFVCKENLICIREVGVGTSWGAPSPISSSSSISSVSEQLKSVSLQPQRSGPRNLHGGIREDVFMQRSVSDRTATQAGGMLFVLPPRGAIQITSRRRLSSEGSSVDSWEGMSRRSSLSSYQSSSTVTDEMLSSSGSLPLPRDEEYEVGPAVLPSVHESDENLPHLSPYHEQGGTGLDVDLYDKLQGAFTKVEDLRKKAFDESCRRLKVQDELLTYHQKAKKSEDLYLKEVQRRKDTEENLARADQYIQQLKQEMELVKRQRDDSLVQANQEIEQVKEEMELVKSQRDNNHHRLQEANEQKSVLLQCITDSDFAAKDLEDKLAAARERLHTLETEVKQLQHERNSAIREAEELRNQRENVIVGLHEAWTSEFSLLELEQATEHFSDALKIGEGGFGDVYKGLLRNMTVAIKMLRSQNLQGQLQFQQEIAVLSRVRHPNLVTLIGACSDASGLVYEFLPNGSLEDRLICANNTPPLTWQVRTRITGEICSALIFLHSNKPHPVVHGDLKPANILLDATLMSKLSDFGLSRLLIQSNNGTTTLYRTTNPRGTIAYMDPEFLTTGELTSRSDVYSFGIIILRLLTGKPPLAIAREVEHALENDDLPSIIDKSAGEWPFVQAKQLAYLGLKCAEMSRRKRPNLVNDVWRVVEPLMKAASLSVTSPPFGSLLDENHIPFYFICPIFQGVMRDPQIAADGFTYEAEAIRSWLDGGHNTSPMTNLTLAHRDLIPNHALRSAIQEYLQQQQQRPVS